MKKGQYFALITGVLFLILGVLGFVPGLQHPVNSSEVHGNIGVQVGYLFGLLPVNPPLNSVYIITGILGLVSALGLGGARIYGRGLAFFYGILAIFGLFSGFNTTFGLMPLFGNDVGLHMLAAAIGFYLGFIDSPGLLEVSSRPPENALPLEKR